MRQGHRFLNSVARSKHRVGNSSRNTIGHSLYHRRLQIELLENRQLLTSVVAHWIGGSGNWSDPTHWDIGVVPNNTGSTTYSAVIEATTSNPVVTIDQAVTIDSLVNSETVQVTNGTTKILNQVENAGMVEVITSPATLILNGSIANMGSISATIMGSITVIVNHSQVIETLIDTQ